MKTAWFLMIIGVFLAIEGTTRIVVGMFVGNYPAAFGGVLTGWLLGVWLFSKGRRRYIAGKQVKSDEVKNV